MTESSGSRHVPARPKVRGERVWLRPIDDDDLEPYYRAINEHDPGWIAGYTHPASRRGVRDWYDNVVVPGHGSTGYWFTICPLGSAEFAGTIWVWDLNHRVPGGEVSLFVCEPGRGLGSDAIRAAVDFGFASALLPRLWGFADEANLRSIAAFERNGFVVEGRMRGAGLQRQPAFDYVQFSMTRAEWLALERPRMWELNESP
jgi:RimJ/RimL family protein N-acetyltransferase